jgi:TRAP-type C4-dicarboxylate transport system substrate-binding protein
MMIENDTVVSQDFWDHLTPDVQEAMRKSGKVVVLTNDAWEELGRLMVIAAWERKFENMHGAGI